MSTAGSDEILDLTGGVITASDIEEVEGMVDPWQFDMRQVSCGPMDARFRIGLVGDILATREHWSHQIVARGISPRGYLAVSGTPPEKSFKWCGHEVNSQNLVCGFDGAECDFATADKEVHWVLLVPAVSLMEYLDPATVESLRARRVFRAEPSISQRLFGMVNRAVDPSPRKPDGQGSAATKLLRAQLLEATSQLILGNVEDGRSSDRRRRYQACLRANAIIESLAAPISVPELAAEVGVGRRTLERAFDETLGISPYRFTRLHRLNRLHRDLCAASGRGTSVTELLTRWGFDELGRTAVEYRDLFGQSPSVTLAKDPPSADLRLADALGASSAD